MTKYMIDPAEGWKYGFPKEMPRDLEGKELVRWLKEQGYPEELTKYPMRTWEEK